MLDDKIDVGEADEQAIEIDLDAEVQETTEPAEQIVVEETAEPIAAEEKPADELGDYSEGVQKRIAKLKLTRLGLI